MAFDSNWKASAQEVTDEDWKRWGINPMPLPEPPEEIPEEQRIAFMQSGWKEGNPIPEPPELPEWEENVPSEYFWNETEMVKPSEVTIARGETNDTLLSIFMSKDELHLSQLDPETMEENVTSIDWAEAQQLISAHSMEVSEEGKALWAKHFSNETKETIPSDVAANKDGVSIEVNAFIDFSQMTIERYGVTEQNCYTVHPEQDLLEEIYRRLCQVDITFEEIDTERLAQMEKAGNIVLSVESESDVLMYDDAGSVDLRITNLDNGNTASVPITAQEAQNAVKAVENYENELNSQKTKDSIEKSSQTVEERN